MVFRLNDDIFDLDEGHIKSEKLKDQECRLKPNECLILRQLLKKPGKRISSQQLQLIVRVSDPCDKTISDLFGDLRRGHGMLLKDYLPKKNDDGYCILNTPDLEILSEDLPVYTENRKIEPLSKINFIKRPELNARIRELLSESKTAVICGISGCGKSELARDFAREWTNQSQSRSVMRFALPQNGETDFDTMLKNSGLFGFEEERITDNTRQRLRRKYMNSLTADTLIIIDNVNSRKRTDLLNDIDSCTGQAKVILTSQLSPEFMGEELGYPCIDMSEKPDSEFFLSLFCSYAGTDKSCSEAILDILSMTGFNCMLTTALASQIKVYGLSEEYIRKKLREDLSLGLSLQSPVKIRKDGLVYKDYPLEIMRYFFGSVLKFRYTPMQRQVIGAWLMCPEFYRNELHLPILVGDIVGSGLHCTKAREALYELYQLNILKPDADGQIHMHALFQQFFTERQKNGEPIGELSPEFADHLLKNELFYYAEGCIFPLSEENRFRRSNIIYDYCCGSNYLFRRLVANSANSPKFIGDSNLKYFDFSTRNDIFNKWFYFYAKDYITDDGVIFYSAGTCRDSLYEYKSTVSRRKLSSGSKAESGASGNIAESKSSGRESSAASEKSGKVLSPGPGSVSLDLGKSGTGEFIRQHMEGYFRELRLHPDQVDFVKVSRNPEDYDPDPMYFRVGSFGFSVYELDTETGEELCVIDCSSALREDSRYFTKGKVPVSEPVGPILPEDCSF